MKHILRIAVTGPESSGKSVLTEALAAHYRTSYAPEYARQYLKETGGGYRFADLTAIAQGQVRNEECAIEASSGICFFDTDMIVLKIWAQFRFNRVPAFIREAIAEDRYDAFLLCKPDLPWEPDPLRESPDPAERMELFDIYQSELRAFNKPVAVVSGEGQGRIERAKRFIDRLLERRK